MSENEVCHVVLQNFGSEGGGWGLAAWGLKGETDPPRPLVYTGSNPRTIEGLKAIARSLWATTGKETKLVRFERRVDVVHYPTDTKGTSR